MTKNRPDLRKSQSIPHLPGPSATDAQSPTLPPLIGNQRDSANQLWPGFLSSRLDQRHPYRTLAAPIVHGINEPPSSTALGPPAFPERSINERFGNEDLNRDPLPLPRVPGAYACRSRSPSKKQMPGTSTLFEGYAKPTVKDDFTSFSSFVQESRTALERNQTGAGASAASEGFHNETQTCRSVLEESCINNEDASTSMAPGSSQQVAVNTEQPLRKSFDPSKYIDPFCKFLLESPTVFHTVDAIAKQLSSNGFKAISERDTWKLERGGKYYVERNGSSLIAFAVGDSYEPGNGIAMVAGHADSITTRLKPIPKLRTKAGFEQLGVAPYAGGLSYTWWDRDLGVGGRVLVKESSGKIVTKLVKLPWAIAKVPTLAPHFGAPANGPFNLETQMVPIVGLDNSDLSSEVTDQEFGAALLGGLGSFTSTQPQRLVKAIAGELSISDYSSIVSWELELFDIQPATTIGLGRELLSGGRLDDKLCIWAATQGLLNSNASASIVPDSTSAAAKNSIKLVALFDDEEIGSLLRQGARGNFLPSTITRINASLHTPSSGQSVEALTSQSMANSFLISADVTHAVNPNFLNVYLENHAPRLNVGPAIEADPNGHLTTDAESTAFLQSVAEKCGSQLQVFQIRNDSRSGGTVGPMLSSAMGCRAIDCGIPQLSMHSIRATTGSLDPGLGVKLFQGFYEAFEAVDAEFRD